MATELTMPKLSDTMAEGTVLKWLIGKGDVVKRGQVIAEVETDKAAMEMEAFEAGTVLELRVPAGETVAVGTVLALFGSAEEAGAGEAAAQAEPVSSTEPAVVAPVATGAAFGRSAEELAEEAPAAQPDAPVAGAAPPAKAEPDERIKVSPAARKLAREGGIDLGAVKGTGPAGRIVVADVQASAGPAGAAGRAPQRVSADESKAKKSVKIRRLVARKMVDSWQNVPHFFVTVAIDMTDVIRFRKSLGVTINDFILAATTAALKEHPWVNSHWVDGEAVEQPRINIAMAVATEQGLYNPVIKDCQALNFKQISRRAAELADKAHHGQLRQGDLEDGTFTISNMGMLGVESFCAIVTPPQAAVLAIGTVRGEVVVDEHEELTVAPLVRLTLSADHRILDGADAAEFLATLKSYLEAPVTLVAGTCFE